MSGEILYNCLSICQFGLLSIVVLLHYMNSVTRGVQPRQGQAIEILQVLPIGQLIGLEETIK
jgi:hypothetical protein